MKSKEKEFHSSLRLNFVIFSSIWRGKRWAKRCVDRWSKSPSINHDKNHNSKVSVVQFSNATRHQPHFLLTSTQFFNFKIINLQIKQPATRINYYKCHENWKILRILREISKNTRSGFMIYRFFYFLLFLLWIYNWKCHSLIVSEKKCWNVIFESLLMELIETLLQILFVWDFRLRLWFQDIFGRFFGISIAKCSIFSLFHLFWWFSRDFLTFNRVT